MRSLRARLILLWVLSLVASSAVGVLLVRLSAQSTAANVARADAVVARACDLIRGRFAFYATGWTEEQPQLDGARLRQDLTTVVAIALAQLPGVEGGIWQMQAGSLAYAYPTYPGDGPKLDLPAAEMERIRAVNAQAAQDEQSAGRRYVTAGQTLLLQACPLSGPIHGATAWTMARVTTAPGGDETTLGLGLLLALMLGMAVGLAAMLVQWSRRVRGMAGSLAAHGGDGQLPQTGDPDLDRVVEALNLSGSRLQAARAKAETLTAQVTVSERLASLGRVAAGVAHEVRNPLATIRLRAENALAADDPARRARALHAILDQVTRLDRLSGELLAMTQRREPETAPVDLAGLLRGCAADHADSAAAAGVTLATQGAGIASLDAAIVRRVLDNLVGNAIRHSPRGGRVDISAAILADHVRLTVEDAGLGVPPELQSALFEPFVTGRADGTGLGLAIARELAEAHGGRLHLDATRPEGGGARFILDLPSHPPAPGASWPPS